MTDPETTMLWQLEERFWTQGSDFYDDNLSAECIMVFPAPAGILDRARVFAALSRAARWSSVSIEQRNVLDLSAATVVLSYRAEAKGSGGGNRSYCAFASSLYVKRDGVWKLAFHQQTPDPM